MNLRKIIAICMIIISVFLQASYAISNSEQTNANTNEVRVRFSSIEYDISDKLGFAKISISNKEDTSIGIAVDNIYPGIYYNINTVLENIGNQGVKVTGISLISNKSENEDSSRLYDMIVGLDEQNIKLKLNDYINHLNLKYVGKIIKSSESLSLNLSMGMDEEITDLENTNCEYQIIINFEQSEKDEGGGDDDDHNGGGNDNGGNGTDSKTTNEDKTVTPEDVKTTDDIKDNTEVYASMPPSTGEELTKVSSLMSILPKSGEKLPISLYITGLALMLAGIFLLKKEKKAV